MVSAGQLHSGDDYTDGGRSHPARFLEWPAGLGGRAAKGEAAPALSDQKKIWPGSRRLDGEASSPLFRTTEGAAGRAGGEGAEALEARGALRRPMTGRGTRSWRTCCVDEKSRRAAGEAQHAHARGHDLRCPTGGVKLFWPRGSRT